MTVKDRSYLQAVAPSPQATAAPAPSVAAIAGALGEPPGYFGAEQQAVWHELITEFGERLAQADRVIFAKLVAAESLYRQAQKEVARVGVLIKSPSGYPIQNPYLAVVNKQHAFIVRTSSELGLTPLSRGRVKPTKRSAPRGNNPFGQLRTLDD